MLRTRHPLDTGNSARLNVLVNQILALGTFHTNSTQDFTDNKYNTGTYIQNPFFCGSLLIFPEYMPTFTCFSLLKALYIFPRNLHRPKKYMSYKSIQVVTLFIRKRKLIIRTDKPARLRYKQKTSGRDFVFDN